MRQQSQKAHLLPTCQDSGSKYTRYGFRSLSRQTGRYMIFGQYGAMSVPMSSQGHDMRVCMVVADITHYGTCGPRLSVLYPTIAHVWESCSSRSRGIQKPSEDSASAVEELNKELAKTWQ